MPGHSLPLSKSRRASVAHEARPDLPHRPSDLTPPLSPCSPLHTRHPGLLTVPQSCQAHRSLNTCALSAILPDICLARFLPSGKSLSKREAFPTHVDSTALLSTHPDTVLHSPALCMAPPTIHTENRAAFCLSPVSPS